MVENVLIYFKPEIVSNVLLEPLTLMTMNIERRTD